MTAHGTNESIAPETPGGAPGCFAHLAFAGLTDTGLRRANNEDAFAVFPGHGACFVADGMGGAADGEVASQAAVDALAEMFQTFPAEKPLSPEAKNAWVADAANKASSWIFERSKKNGKTGTGTTLAGVCFDPAEPGRAVALHAGDSRVYHVSGDKIRLVTRDHSFANEVGVEEESKLNPEFRNIILRALGLAPRVEMDATPFQFAAGDFILVCSDGLTRMVDDATIASLVKPGDTPEAAARALLAKALENGGRDNVTAVLVKAGALPAPRPAAELEANMPPPVAAPPRTAETPGTVETADTGARETPEAKKPARVFWIPLLAAALAVGGAVWFLFTRGAE